MSDGPRLIKIGVDNKGIIHAELLAGPKQVSHGELELTPYGFRELDAALSELQELRARGLLHEPHTGDGIAEALAALEKAALDAKMAAQYWAQKTEDGFAAPEERSERNLNQVAYSAAADAYAAAARSLRTLAPPHTGPRTWQMPEIPDDVRLVEGRGRRYVRTSQRIWSRLGYERGRAYTPGELLAECGPLTEVPDVD